MLIKNTLSTKIKKIVSASNSKTLNFLSKLYGSIIKAGIHKAKSIRIAEAAKVIEIPKRFKHSLYETASKNLLLWILKRKMLLRPQIQNGIF